MKKLSFLFFLFMFSLTNDAQQNKDVTVGDYKNELEIINKRIDSLDKLNGKNLTDSLRRINDSIDGIKEKNNEFDWKSLMPWILTVIAIAISYLVYKREGSYKHLTFLTDKNKMMVSEPKLWALYDTYRAGYSSDLILNGGGSIDIVGQEELTFLGDGNISIKPVSGVVTVTDSSSNNIIIIDKVRDFPVNNKSRYEISGKATVMIPSGISIEIKKQEKELDGKIRAFCYYTLNSFELVFKYNRAEDSVGKAWGNYMIDILMKSSAFREIVKEEVNGNIFSEDYQEKLRDFIAIYDIIEKLKDSGRDHRINDVFKYKERIWQAIKSNYLTKDSNAEEIEKFLDPGYNNI